MKQLYFYMVISVVTVGANVYCSAPNELNELQKEVNVTNELLASYEKQNAQAAGDAANKKILQENLDKQDQELFEEIAKQSFPESQQPTKDLAYHVLLNAYHNEKDASNQEILKKLCLGQNPAKPNLIRDLVSLALPLAGYCAGKYIIKNAPGDNFFSLKSWVGVSESLCHHKKIGFAVMGSALVQMCRRHVLPIISQKIANSSYERIKNYLGITNEVKKAHESIEKIKEELQKQKKDPGFLLKQALKVRYGGTSITEVVQLYTERQKRACDGNRVTGAFAALFSDLFIAGMPMVLMNLLLCRFDLIDIK